MLRPIVVIRPIVRVASGLAIAVALLASQAQGADAVVDLAPVPAAGTNFTFEVAQQHAERFANLAVAWYRRTPPVDRVTWGGLVGCAVLGLLVLMERTIHLRRGRVTPTDFLRRFRERLQDGKLDRGKALDLCELNPSPAARVALAAVKRWGRPVADLERAVALASRVENDRLKRNVGTFRRISAMAPLIGLLGTLIASGRALSVGGENWGSALGTALIPLTVGVALSILALVIYDGLVGRVETLSGSIDRLAAETVDAIAMSAPQPPEPVPSLHRANIEPRRGPHAPIRPLPHRIEIPDHLNPRHDDPFDD